MKHALPRLALLLATAITAACDDDAQVAVDAALVPDAATVEVAGEAPPEADAATPDASAPDAATPDASAPEIPAEPAPYPRPQYRSLRETGLYADLAGKRLAPELRRFSPTHVLWSDAADKDRHLYLPPGTRIDTSDMDHWRFPIGTKVWKQFARAGKRLETRLVERYGPGPEDFWMGAFAWSEREDDALFVEDGASDVRGTDHDVPAAKICLSCHRGEPGRLLGVTAIQLSHAATREDPITLGTLAAEGRLSHPPPEGVDYALAGDAVTVAAFGYLHANCGHCHNRNGTSWPDTQVVLRLATAERALGTSEVFTTLVGRPLQYWRRAPLTLRVAPGDPAASALVARMQVRGARGTQDGKDQMPPLATKHPDANGIDLVTRWIAALPH